MRIGLSWFLAPVATGKRACCFLNLLEQFYWRLGHDGPTEDPIKGLVGPDEMTAHDGEVVIHNLH